MVYLNNITTFPEKAEWAYLYAVADIYQNYSYPVKEKEGLFEPHPLKDSEVIEILCKKYNLPNVHRNTIANIRKKMEKYFGFVFGSYKKGKYLIQTSIDDDETIMDISLIAELVVCSPFISQDIANELLSTLTKAIEYPELKKNIELEMSRNKQNREYTLKKGLLKYAILNGKHITFYYDGKKVERKKPIKINKSVLNCEPVLDGFYPTNETYYISGMEYISIE